MQTWRLAEEGQSETRGQNTLHQNWPVT